MALFPLKLPPGVFRNGTNFQASGRWTDADRVRWADGTMMPIGGWATRTAFPSDEPPRAALAWVDNSQDRWLAVGTANKLMVMNAASETFDITPDDLAAGRIDAGVNTGYGGGLFGSYAYGVSRPEAAGSSLPPTTWFLDTWGEELIAMSSTDGRLFSWALVTGDDAAVIPNAPEDNAAMFVTDERFLMALGAGGDPRRVEWSDREDRETWTPATTNEAGGINLQTQGRLMRGIPLRGRSLILTDQDAFTATYLGPPFVYGFEKVSADCTLISPRAVVPLEGGAIWMGLRGFYRYDGAAVTEIPCDVADFAFRTMNVRQREKVWAVSLAQHSEVWWFYPGEDGMECDRYVCLNTVEGHWAIGRLRRTAGVDRGAFRDPIWLTPDAVAFNHEVGFAYPDNGGAYAESGPISLGNGDQVFMVRGVIPDELTKGEVDMAFGVRFYPNGAERRFGPYAAGEPTRTRFTGRQVSMRVTGQSGKNWRVGIMRLDLAPGGER